jgi:GntR family transcriptional repressor for pyruvate dehydrogenase complex
MPRILRPEARIVEVRGGWYRSAIGQKSDNGHEPPPALGALRVRKAYEQIADHLRELILAGTLGPDQRLPSEAALAERFGVSRATVREALRVLATQNLIRTTKGARGGSFVRMPSVDHVSDLIHANVTLLGQSEDLTLDDFLEVRECLEVPAARMAAHRRSGESLDELAAAIPGEPLRLSTAQQFVHNRDFHTVLVAACGNRLLSLATRPVFSVLQTHLQRSTLADSELELINHEHRAILAALREGDAEAAAAEMRDHLASLRPMYERAWRFRRR